MLTIFDSFRDITFLNIVIRMLLAMACGGIVGIEREVKRRPAGFRTHILICLGGTMTTMTSLYLIEKLGMYTDPARLGAQVIAGVGFIGTGAIIVTRNKQVKGLTTAAGLWAVAICGLAIGAGFYEGAILTALLILLAEFVFGKLEGRLVRTGVQVSLIVDFEAANALYTISDYLEEKHITINNMETGKNRHGEPYAIFSLFIPSNVNMDRDQLIADISEIEGSGKTRIL